MPGKAMTWNLDPLVPSTRFEDIQVQMNQFLKDAKQFASEYKGKVTSLDAKGLLAFTQRIEKEYIAREGAITFAGLKYAANSLDPDAKQISDLARRMNMQIQQTLAFIDVELAHLLASKPEIIDDPILTEYKHALERHQRKAPYLLSEIEEQLILQKDRFGIDAWSQLQGDWLSTRTFEIQINGEVKVMPYGEIISLYEDPNRELRKAANSIVYTKLGKDEILWASALRAIIGDHIEISKKRKWPSPRTQSLIDNDVDAETIDALMKTIKAHVMLYRRYLKLKAKLMNLPKLANYDIIAPLPSISGRTFTWDEAQKITIELYLDFDPELGKITKKMFSEKRIDSEVRKGKRSGAFFSSWYKGKMGFILQSFNGRMGDIFTIAHENGHAIHSYLMSSNQSLLNTDIGMCSAETASIFAELLLADKLISEAKTEAEKVQVLAKILDEFGMAAFQVSARYFFEMALYDAFERGEYLDGELIAKYWTQSRDKIYGDAVEWLEEMKWEWTMKPHYYRPRFRLYNYPYVFAQLYVFALYRIYRKEGKDFVPKLRRILSAGSMQSPRELAAELGFDITKTDFWALGMKQAEEFIQELESLAD